MRYTKMHGLGNEFIMLAGESILPENASEQAIKLCDRQHGLGADGLVYILPSAKDHFKMRVFDASGNESLHFTDAIHCVAKYVFDHRLIDEPEMTIETLQAGSQTVHLTIEDDKVATVHVDLGEPSETEKLHHSLEVDGVTFNSSLVSLQEPYGVIYVDDAASIDMNLWGPKLSNHPYFPSKVNVVFVTVKSNIHASIRVWEHSTGLSLGSGAAAAAALVSSVRQQKMDEQATVSLQSGRLFVEWDQADNRVYLTGRAKQL